MRPRRVVHLSHATLSECHGLPLESPSQRDCQSSQTSLEDAASPDIMSMLHNSTGKLIRSRDRRASRRQSTSTFQGLSQSPHVWKRDGMRSHAC
eukprot:1946320-Amphidinium_carterae.2